MSEHDSELTAQVKKLQSDVESLGKAFEAHSRDHVPTQGISDERQAKGGSRTPTLVRPSP
jgi:hypothetical protein